MEVDARCVFAVIFSPRFKLRSRGARRTSASLLVSYSSRFAASHRPSSQEATCARQKRIRSSAHRSRATIFALDLWATSPIVSALTVDPEKRGTSTSRRLLATRLQLLTIAFNPVPVTLPQMVAFGRAMGAPRMHNAIRSTTSTLPRTLRGGRTAPSLRAAQ